MRYHYYPGCSLEGTAREYDLATRAVVVQDGIEAISKLRRAGVAVIGAARAEQAAPAAGQETCLKAPEWAEHQRFSDEDMGCDDGRAG